MTNPSETRDSELVARARELAGAIEFSPIGARKMLRRLADTIERLTYLLDTVEKDAGEWIKARLSQREAADTIDRLTSTGEAVAWMHPSGAWVDHRYEEVAMHCGKDGPQPVPLYTHASPREGHVEVPVETLRNAVLSCSHTITAEEIVLRRSDRMDGNALNQLHQRLAAALIPTKPEAKEQEDALYENLSRAELADTVARYGKALSEIANFSPKSDGFSAPTETAAFCQERARAALQSKKPE